MTNRAVIYTRVSTDEQAEHGYSLQSQTESCHEYAVRQGLTVVEEISDDYSGAKFDRPGLKRIREKIDRQEVDAIIVYSPDRLTRNLAHSLILREEWQIAGIELHYCNRGKLENTPEGRMTENIEAVFADYWRTKIIEASARGRRTKAANGKWPCDGHPAYGYGKEGKGREAHLVINKIEAEIIRRIFELYTGIKTGKPIALQAIAALLTAESVPPPNRGSGMAHPGKGWHKNSVRKVLARRSYIGEFEYAGNRIYLPELAIVDRETFEAAEKRRAGSSAISNTKRKYEYLVAGRITCTCGLNMSGCPMQGGKYLYYACNSSFNNPHLRNCTERLIRADLVDALTWQWLTRLLYDEDSLKEGLLEVSEIRHTELQPKRARLDIIENLIADAERKVKKLAAAFAAERDEVVEAALRGEMKAAGRERELLAAEREAIQAELRQGEITESDRAIILGLAAEIRQRLGEPSYESKRSLVNMLDVRLQLVIREEQKWLKITCGLTLPQTSNGSLTEDLILLSPLSLCGASSSTTTTSPRSTSSFPSWSASLH
jgi:site-specific DNA recombinase